VVNSNLEGFPVRVDVNHRADVANLEAFGRDRLRENDAIVLLDHVEDHPFVDRLSAAAQPRGGPRSKRS
jgi:hypothetical protein